MSENTIEHVVARGGRTYRVNVPESTIELGTAAVEAYVNGEVKRQDDARVAAEASATASGSASAPAAAPEALTPPEEE